MSSQTEVAQDLLKLEDEAWAANRAGDGSYYQRILRDDAVGVSQYGLADKAQAVSVIEANRNPYLRTELDQQRVIPIGDGGALITYRAQVTAAVDGQGERTFTVLATTVYARENGTWKSVLHQQTPLPNG